MTSRTDTALARLREQGERITPARRAVVDVLAGTSQHLDAEAVSERVGRIEPGVHRATVYRTLQSLCEAGVVGHTHVPGAPTIYHLAGDPTEHAHLQCDRCGRVLDMPTQWLESLAARARAELGFVVQPTHTALLGRCAECAAPPA